MTEKKELNNEELNKVSGGSSNNPYSGKYWKNINKYDLDNYIGQVLYFDVTVFYGTMVDDIEWIYGTLLKTYEKDTDCGTERTATVSIIDTSGYPQTEGVVDINMDKWHAYKKNDQ